MNYKGAFVSVINSLTTYIPPQTRFLSSRSQEKLSHSHAGPKYLLSLYNKINILIVHTYTYIVNVSSTHTYFIKHCMVQICSEGNTRHPI